MMEKIDSWRLERNVNSILNAFYYDGVMGPNFRVYKLLLSVSSKLHAHHKEEFKGAKRPLLNK